MTCERLNKSPQYGDPPAYISVHRGIGGWNSALWRWCGPTQLENGDKIVGFYEPVITGFTNTIGTGERKDAIAEAINWAECENLPLWIPELKEGDDI